MKKDRGIRMKEKVNVTGVPETMIQTLYARAKESGKKDAKIKDDMAMEIVSKLDYDFQFIRLQNQQWTHLIQMK